MENLDKIEIRPDLDSRVVFDLVQLINMFGTGSTRRGMYDLYFKPLRSNWVTTNMDTIWVLSAQSVEETIDTCEIIGGDDMASKDFFVKLCNKMIDSNPKFEYMRKFIKK